jgi:uncharacterized membrane protein YfcA
MDLMVVIFGLGVGILIGLTGIGGGSLMTPLLVVFAGIKPTIAIGTDLAYGAITKTVGAWRHLHNGTVDLGVALWLAAGSIPGSIAGIWLLKHLALSSNTLLICVGTALIIAAVAILIRSLFLVNMIKRERHKVELTPRTKIAAVGMGLILGLMLGMTSVGSGALIGLVLIIIFRLTPHRTVGTDIFHAAILLWAAGLAHLVSGNVDLVLMGNILVGSVPGIYIGTALAPRIPANALRIVLGCVLLASALAIFTKTSLAIPTGVVFGIPLAVGLLSIFLYPKKFPAAAKEVSSVAD